MRMPHKHILAVVVAAAISAPAASAAAERFTFARPAAPGSTVDPTSGRLNLVIDHWATDADRDQVLSALAENGPERLLDAFRNVARVGTLYWPGGLEYTVRYARQAQRPDGSSDVVLVVDRPVWTWWDAGAGSPSGQYTVVHLRLSKAGTGEGRISRDVQVRRDDTLGVTLADDAKAPVMLTDVRREQSNT
jgi:hypothetical protein